jgi:hypothetical protein
MLPFEGLHVLRPASPTGICLGLIARTAGDAIAPLVMPIAETNIRKHDRHCPEAAICVFDSILEGPYDKDQQLSKAPLIMTRKSYRSSW